MVNQVTGMHKSNGIYNNKCNNSDSLSCKLIILAGYEWPVILYLFLYHQLFSKYAIVIKIYSVLYLLILFTCLSSVLFIFCGNKMY